MKNPYSAAAVAEQQAATSPQPEALAHKITIELDLTQPLRPLRIVPTPSSGTVLDEEEIRVNKGDSIVYTSKKQFSLFFPDEQVMDTPHGEPATGGEVFKSGPASGGHEVTVRVSDDATQRRSYEYFITVVDNNLVYTDDPEVYVC